MMSENLLIDYKRYCELYYTAAIIIGVIIIVSIIGFIVGYLDKHDKKSIIAFVVSVLIGLFVGYKSLMGILDYPSVRNNESLIFSGEVIGFKEYYEENDGDIRYYYPIFENDKGERMAFNVGGVELGKTYEIEYLKYTKCSALVKND